MKLKLRATKAGDGAMTEASKSFRVPRGTSGVQWRKCCYFFTRWMVDIHVYLWNYHNIYIYVYIYISYIHKNTYNELRYITIHDIKHSIKHDTNWQTMAFLHLAHVILKKMGDPQQCSFISWNLQRKVDFLTRGTPNLGNRHTKFCLVKSLDHPWSIPRRVAL
jgi:hypothetical protein